MAAVYGKDYFCACTRDEFCNEACPIYKLRDDPEFKIKISRQHCHNTGEERIFKCSECGYGIFDIFISDEAKYPIYPKYCPNCGAIVESDGE